MPPVLSRYKDSFQKERDNYIRISFLVIESGSACVRKIFDEEIHPSKLLQVLNTKQCILRQVIKPNEMKILYPQRGQPSVTSKKLDLTLMVSLLKHVADRSIGDIFPVATDDSIDADLARLKWYRNTFAHLPGTRVNHQTFDIWYTDLLKVIKRRGDPVMIKDCEDIRDRDLKCYNNYVNSVITQILATLSIKGYKSLELAANFWYFPPIQQLRFILQLFETHFWIYPPICVIWNEYQDSLHQNSDIKFQRTECQSKLDPSCFPSSQTTTETKHIEGSHTIEIELKSCAIPGKSSKMTQNKIQRIICFCMKGSVAAQICLMTLFTRLDTRLYSHDHNMSQNHNMKPDHITITDNEVTLSIKDCTYAKDKKKGNKDIENKPTMGDKERMISTAKDLSKRCHDTHIHKKDTEPVVCVKRRKNLVAEEGAFTMGSTSFLPRMQSSFGATSCSNYCVCFPSGAQDNLLN